jgi:hypothetical protein
MHKQTECLLEEMRIKLSVTKGNECRGRVLNHAAHDAVKNKGSYFRAVFPLRGLGRVVSPPSGLSLIGSAAG